MGIGHNNDCEIKTPFTNFEFISMRMLQYVHIQELLPPVFSCQLIEEGPFFGPLFTVIKLRLAVIAQHQLW